MDGVLGPVPRGSAHLKAPTGIGSVHFAARYLGGFGGGDRAGVDILLAIMAAGVDVTVVCENTTTMPAIDVDVRRPPRWVVAPRPLGWPRLAGRSARQVASDLKSLVVLACTNVGRAKNLVRDVSNNPPAIVIHNGFPHPRARHLAVLYRASSGPRVLVVHSSARQVPGFATNVPGLNVETLVKEMSACDAIVFVSPQIRDEWLALMDGAPPIVRVIPPCGRDERIDRVRLESRALTRQHFGYADNDFVIVTVGKVHPNKGQDQIIASMNQIVDHIPHAKLVVVGARTPESAMLDNEVRRLRLCDRVRFTGATEEALQHIYAADVLIHASKAEGSPLVVAEAMALETPIIASDAGGIPTQLLDGKAGLMFSVDDRDAMVQCVLLQVSEPQATRARVAAARQHYISSYSRPVMNAAYANLLKELGIGQIIATAGG